MPSPRRANPQDTVAMLIGPEGGWTDDEREHFIAAGWTPVSLGRLILRAETAALAALARLVRFAALAVTLRNWSIVSFLKI